MALRSSSGFLKRLAGDTSGNTLAIMTAAMLPLAGMVGGALDMSRLYLVRTRAQQACDAGALAGRKRMGGGQWDQAQGAPNQAAIDFFDSNFRSGSYGTGTLTRAYAENAGKVTGTASVVIPMTLMKIFGRPSERISVTCDAEMKLPNTDVMFVLDTTGSMGFKAVSSDTQTKIAALRSAVKCFYEIVSKIDTTEVCVTGTPTGGTGSTTQVRFGFLPYATNVNVGRLLPPAYFADRWSYQSRVWVPRPQSVTTYTDGTPTVISETQINQNPSSNDPNTYTLTQTTSATSQANCATKMPISATPASTGPESAPSSSNTTISGSNRTTTWQTTQPHRQEYQYGALWVSPSTCYIGRRIITFDLRRDYRRVDPGTTTIKQVFDKWRYAQLEKDIRGLKNGSGWNTSFTLPVGNTADGAEVPASKTINWDGCIEERKTEAATSYTSATGGAAKDLDIDTVPNTGDPQSLWGPALYDLIYARGFERLKDPNTGVEIRGLDISKFSMTVPETATNYATILRNNEDAYFCPTEAKKLQTWPTASSFENYVNGLTVYGNTYHDIGLIWGARFISPTGIFSSENALTPQGGEIERHLIFMTDGETCTSANNYGPYGLPWYDRRQLPTGSDVTYGCETETSTGGTLSEQVNARYAAVCTAVKNKNITLWVIWFGESKPNLEGRLRACATPSRFHIARNSADLQTTFASIANQISQLRLTS